MASKAAASSYPTSPTDSRTGSDSARLKPCLSDISDDDCRRSDTEKTNFINACPTYPTENKGTGEEAANLLRAVAPLVPADAACLQIFDYGGDQLLGYSTVRPAMLTLAERAIARAQASVTPALAAEPGEVWLRGKVDE